jgi:diguanylate cyclase (GGDEF)-like protein
MPAAVPPDEAARLGALHRYELLGSGPEEVFERIARLASQLAGAPIALVSLIDADRQWHKAAHGLALAEIPRDSSFCAHTILGTGALVIADARTDPRVATSSVVAGPPFVVAYAGVPIRTGDGFALGAVCALDTRPRLFGDDVVAGLRDLAALAMDAIEHRVRAAEAALERRVHVLEAILQTAGEAILVVDRDGRYQMFNETARRLLGRDPGEVPPLARADSYGAFEADGVTPMELDRLPLVRALRGEPVDREALWLRNPVTPGGAFLSATARPLRDGDGSIRGAVGTFSDVTALVEAKASLAHARAELADRVDILEAVLESAGEGIMVADADGRLLVANPLARFITGTAVDATDFPHDGWTRDVGMYRADGRTILPMDEMPLLRAVRGEPTYGIELYVRNERIPDGRYLQVTGRTIRDRGGRPRGGVIVLSDISLLKHTQAQVTALALLDELTGLANRRAFRERLAALGRAGREGRHRDFALTLVDIDHFKRINDVHGHDVGDLVLIAAARTLREHARRGDLVARIGGEEFCVLQADITADAIALAEDLRIAIASITAPVAITASFGVCHTGIAPPDRMLKGADQALYRAKRAGRDRVVLANGSDLAPVGASP